jgi:Ni/Co efflux regulator RcnB
MAATIGETKEISMKKFVCAVAALALLGSSAAFAQMGRPGRNQHKQTDQHMQNSRGAQNNNHMQGPGAQHEVRGHPHWSRGDRLPQDYRGRNTRYVVADWRGHHLRRPPRGYHWVEIDGRYVLAAVATGLILDVILGGH